MLNNRTCLLLKCRFKVYETLCFECSSIEILSGDISDGIETDLIVAEEAVTVGDKGNLAYAEELLNSVVNQPQDLNTADIDVGEENIEKLTEEILNETLEPSENIGDMETAEDSAAEAAQIEGISSG